MKQVFSQRGQIVVLEVPAPAEVAGRVRVKTAYSCISPGTELASLKASSGGLVGKALREPGRAAQALELLIDQGLASTWELLVAKHGHLEPLGYSLAGRIVDGLGETGELRPGMAVACAGSRYAFHAEIVSVPKNLVVPLPEGLDPRQAATVALGAIAMQGVRRLEPALGETIAVIGLGILGQLVCQMLRACGCRVMASDARKERTAWAEELAGALPLETGKEGVDMLRRIVAGGVDGVIITASSPSSEIVASAFAMCRRRGRVVLVGDVGLDLKREDIYEKELDFRVSTSYGPGRYDPAYEEEGCDYPPAHVPWTEGRNMREYLRLLGEKRLVLPPAETTAVDEAAVAYSRLEEASEKRPLYALLEMCSECASPVQTLRLTSSRAESGAPGLALIGGGGFARHTHLPNLKRLPEGLLRLRCVVGRSGHKVAELAKQYGAAYATTDVEEVLRDEEVRAVLISTRHDSHASLTLRALEAGKHVLVEKPLAMNEKELLLLEEFYRKPTPQEKPLLLTGFNRPFSPFIAKVAELFSERKSPLIMQFTIKAENFPAGHWTLGPEGGGRNLGEACHYYDLALHLAGCGLEELSVLAAGPTTGSPHRDFSVALRFTDGSLTNLLYTTAAAKE
ncbi:MAG: bi-domain-containing oxidoreductase, partial [Planctomycetes bacterium]|nr:bi-domain-containing oxidoreductase [Planctomycetota bacterium]